jgi:predicted acetyltransferase
LQKSEKYISIYMNLSVSERRRLMALQLKKLDESMKGALADFMADWKDEEIIPSTLQKYSLGFDELMAHLDTMENDPPRLLVPGSVWFLTDGDEILGAIEVRHFLNSGLLKYGGHIGYGVAPKHRGHGYAAQMVKMVMPQLKKLGLEMVLLCCVSDNVASARTIVNAGGVLENEVEIIRNNQPKIGQRYWLEVK